MGNERSVSVAGLPLVGTPVRLSRAPRDDSAAGSICSPQASAGPTGEISTLCWLVLLGIAFAGSCFGLRAASPHDITLHQADGRVRVEIGGKLFTEYVFKGGPKPYLYPILAADDTELTRNFPVKPDVPGEVRDHPHHRSLWFAHGPVNGVDFWKEGKACGTIVSEAVESSVEKGVALIRARNRWIAPDGTPVCADETTLRIRLLALRPDGQIDETRPADGRLVDYEVMLRAPADRPLVFGDSKEGTLAIRLPLWMTPSHRNGKETHAGEGVIVSSTGARNGDAWGKRAEWVDYHAPKDGKIYGVALFDHPQNPRHPTWWHVRDYGLFAANPFGQHDFEPEHRGNPHAGDLAVPAGGSVTFRYRFYFHGGDEKTARVDEQFRAYAAER